MDLQSSDRMVEYPIYALAYTATKILLLENPNPIETEIPSEILKRNYSINDIAVFVSDKQKRKYKKLGIKGDALLPLNNPKFLFPLKERDIKIMGKLANIDFDTWKKVIKIGNEYLQVTNRNWYQTNDNSFDQTFSIQEGNRKFVQHLHENQELRGRCQQFIENCPSKWYRAAVRLALLNRHWCSGSTGEDYENHNYPIV